MGGSHINTQILRARAAESRSVWIAAVAIPLMLLAPALWNGYPRLQWDTGGYLARWYEGYLVPSRSTVFGLYLHFGEDSAFWINLGIQALVTLAGTVSFALLGNAVVCGVISGPHDRYGARLAWIATMVVLIAAVKHFTSETTAHWRRERKSTTPAL